MKWSDDTIALRLDREKPFRTKWREARGTAGCRWIWVVVPKEFDRDGTVRLWGRDRDESGWSSFGRVRLDLILLSHSLSSLRSSS